MEIDFAKLTNDALLSVISGASAELTKRANQPTIRVESSSDVVEKIISPPAADEFDFIRWALSATKSGGLVRATEKDRYAELSKKYPAWFSHKKLPSSLRGSGPDKFIKYGRIP